MNYLNVNFFKTIAARIGREYGDAVIKLAHGGYDGKGLAVMNRIRKASSGYTENLDSLRTYLN